MNDSDETQHPFGTYSPQANTSFLRWLTKAGLAHGKISKAILKQWLHKHGPMVDAEVRRIKYRLDLSNNATDIKVLISSKVYDQPELEALTRASKGKTFVDIGANTGYYSLNLAATSCQKVIAIEPNPPTLNRLRFNIDANGFKNRITIIPEGVGPDGELELYQTPGLGSASFVATGSDTPTIKVRTRPLLTMLASHGVEQVGGMKIDVEGFEDKVLGPFLQDSPPSLLPTCLVMESCHGDDWEVDLKALLESKGFKLAKQTRANMIFLRGNI